MKMEKWRTRKIHMKFDLDSLRYQKDPEDIALVSNVHSITLDNVKDDTAMYANISDIGSEISKVKTRNRDLARQGRMSATAQSRCKKWLTYICMVKAVTIWDKHRPRLALAFVIQLRVLRKRISGFFTLFG